MVFITSVSTNPLAGFLNVFFFYIMQIRLELGAQFWNRISEETRFIETGVASDLLYATRTAMGR